MLVAALTLLNAPASFNRLEVAVSPVEVISSSQLERLPVADLSQILTVRPQSPSQPVERSGSLVLVDGARTASDINALNNIESIQVLRGPQGTLYGRSEADALGSVVHLALRDTQRAYENVKLRGFSFDPKQGIQSGGFTQWTLSSSYKDLFGIVQVFGVTEGGQPARTLLGSRQVYLGTYLDPDPPKSQFFPDTMPNSRLLDTIGGMTLQPKYADMLGTSQILIPPAGGLPGAALTTNATSYFANTASYYGSEMVNGWVQRSGLQMGQISQMMMGAAAQGSDMNSLTFPGDPGAFANSDCGSNVRFPGGTLWVPDQAGYQTMMNASPFRYQFRGFHASLDGGEIQGQMRTYCLNMELKEPAPGVRYFPYAPTTPVLGALAKIENRSTVRGLYDQARTWIYTDKAPLAEINKRLFPTITPGRYVTSLWEVVRVGGFTTKDLA
ncbi:MAG TPA: Plug domain-containing protein, partial [Fimbriimonadaceae bacterium]|nr:Plug domain-containing protein [Fimbriimonadaceae bacterium]